MPTISLPSPPMLNALPGALYRFAAKPVDTVESYSVDFSSWVTSVPGDALQSCTLTITPQVGASDSLDAAGTPQVTNNGATVLLTGGLAGQDHALKWVGTSASGRALSVITMLYVPPVVAPVQTAIVPLGYGTTPGADVLTSLVASFPTSPVGLRVGMWWSNGGVPQQVPNDYPTSPDGLLPGSFWLKDGIVNQTLAPQTIPSAITAGQTSSDLLNQIVSGLPTSPIGLRVQGWWLNQGVPQQVPADMPTSTDGLLPGSYYLLNGRVAQTLTAGTLTPSTATSGSQLLAQLVAGLPTSPVGLHVGDFWMNAGLIEQVPPTLPTAAGDLLPGTYWLNNGTVAQV